MFDVHLRRPAVPVGTGDCCAPKLLAHAIRLGLVPVGIAEFYFGTSARQENSRTEKPKASSASKKDARTIKLTADSPIEFHNACEPRCQQILGFMLCGLDETRDQLLL